MTLLEHTRSKLRGGVGTSPVVGLDIGCQSIKLVAVERHKDSARVTTACSLPAINQEIADDGQLQRLLTEVIRDSGLAHGTQCVFSLPSSLVDYQAIECNANLTSEDLLSLAHNAIHELLGSERDQASFDFWQTSINEAVSELHLVWTIAEHANRITRALYRSGLRPQTVEAPALALARLALDGSVSDRCLVADIGAGEVTFVWSNVGRAQYIRNRIKFYDASASQSLATAHNLDHLSAEQLLKYYGINDRGENALAVENFRAIEGWLDKLLFEINRTCQHLHVRYGHSAIEQLWLCGGGASISGISQWIAARTGIRTSITRPPECCWTAAEPYSPLYAQAVALALHGEPS